jgi:hypothetical protein
MHVYACYISKQSHRPLEVGLVDRTTNNSHPLIDSIHILITYISVNSNY